MNISHNTSSSLQLKGNHLFDQKTDEMQESAHNPLPAPPPLFTYLVGQYFFELMTEK